MDNSRLKKILSKMDEKDLKQTIISDPATIFYLTGEWIHSGERLLALILRTDGKHSLIINKLFPVQTDLGVKKIFIDDTDNGIAILNKQLISDTPIGVDKYWAAHFVLELMKACGHTNFVNGSLITDAVRGVKEATELDLLREASTDNDEAIKRISELIPAELTESEMAQRLAMIYKELGNSGFSFEPIIAYGANGADPHHETDESTIKVGDSIIVDIGGVKNGYCSDMTRTFFYKEVSEKAREVYEVVREAQQRAIDVVKPGVKFSEIDAAARDYIIEMGYGEFFTHRTGHFIGIECHEAGDVSASNHRLAEVGNVFSIEPGIYLLGEVGVRIEDLVVVTEEGCEVLNHYPKELTILS